MLLRPCPACARVDTVPVMDVVTCDGVLHTVPLAWMTDRRAALERVGLLPIEALRAAYLEWAATCVLGQES